MVQFLILIVLLVSSQGCASGREVLRGIDSAGARVYLSAPEEIPFTIERYYGIRDLTTEEGKIDYLLTRVQDSDYVFIRNKARYNAYSAAKFLRWKFERLKTVHHVDIKTAKDFIDRSASSSKMSGKAYVVEMGGNHQHYLSSIFRNELDLLEFHLERYRKIAEQALTVSPALPDDEAPSASEQPPAAPPPQNLPEQEVVIDGSVQESKTTP